MSLPRAVAAALTIASMSLQAVVRYEGRRDAHRRDMRPLWPRIRAKGTDWWGSRRDLPRRIFRLSRRRVFGLACGAAAAGTLAVHQYETDRYLNRASTLQPALAAWHREFEADKERLATSRVAGREALESLASRLASIQSRVVELDALAKEMSQDREPDSRDFDFEAEPGLGGPEELPQSTGPDLRLPGALAWLSAQVDDRWRQLHVLQDLLDWREQRSAVRPEGRPVSAGYVSSAFGVRIDPFTGRKTPHYGMDFAARRGTQVVAVAAGIVTWTGPRGGYGKLVEIDHGNGRVTRYAHNSEVLVRVGQVVRRGEPIAKLGSTGRATGPNLHFEVRENGRPVDPKPFVD